MKKWKQGFEVIPGNWMWDLSSDFVTNGYGVSWDSSCEKPWVPVKKKSLKLKMLWLLCNHTVNPKTDSKTLYYSVLKLKYSHCPSILHCKAQQRRKKCVLLSNSHNNCHRNYTNRILLTHMFRSINLLIFASYGTHAMNYLASLRTNMRQGRRRQR